MNITLIRRISQIIFLVLLIYGGFLLSHALNVTVAAPPRGTEADTNLIDQAIPLRSCRYIQPKPTLFESCQIRYLMNIPLNNPNWTAIAVSLAVILGMSFVFGRFMCGWFCPLGFLADIMDWIRAKLGISRIVLSEPIERVLKLWRYGFLLFLAFLAVALVLPFAYGIYMDKNFYEVACQVCPARSILPLLGGQLPVAPSFITWQTSFFSTLSLIFLCIWLSGLIITRAWCRICPNGTLSSLFTSGALMSKHKNPRKCTRCGICTRVCNFSNQNICDEKRKETIINTNCVMCGKCVENCPEKDCLSINFCGIKIFSSEYKKKGRRK